MSSNFPLSGPAAGRKGGITVSQTPGGTQSFNLFGGNEPAVVAPKPSIQVAPSSSNVSIYSPFSNDPNAQAPPPPKSSIAVNPNSNTFKSDANSPFSKEPAPRHGRTASQANQYSSDSPFSAAPAPVVQQQSSFVPKANIPDKNSPFSNTEYLAPAPAGWTPQANVLSANSPFGADSGPVTPQKPSYTPKANVQSEFSPFTPSADLSVPAPERRPSLASMQTPGGRQQINLFAPPPEQQVPATVTPTYGYADNSPFNKSPVASPPSMERRPSIPKANLPSDQNPFTASGPVPVAQPPSFVPKANIPANDSPFSQAPQAAPRSDRDAANRVSSYSPFAAGPSPVVAAPNSSVRIQQTPGGNQSFNLFGSNGYAQ